MKLPKIAAILAVAVAVFGALNTADILMLLPHGWASLITAGAAIVAVFSSAVGTNVANMIRFPKIIGILGVLASVFGALNTADVLAVLPEGMASFVTLAGVICAALARALGGNSEMLSTADKQPTP